MPRPGPLLAFLMLIPATAVAAPDGSPTPTAPPATAAPGESRPVEAEPPSGLDAFQQRDAGSGRALYQPSAVTAPQGTVAVTILQPPGPLGAVAVTASITDRIELTAGGVWILFDGAHGAPLLGARAQLWRSTRAAVAVTALRGGDLDDSVDALGVAGSMCVDGDACGVLVTAHVDAVIEERQLSSGGNVRVPLVAGGSVVAGRYVAKLVAEVHGSVNPDGSFVAGYLGFRYGSPRLAFDGGAVFLCELDNDDGPAGVPMFGMTMRR